jgi:glycosyltransferase involved in cell wall biosynthesis
VKFTGWRSNEEIAEYYRGCRAVLFPGEEDFGIVPLEAMASGKPVVAFARGGALETVLERADLRTGVLFSEQSVSSLEGALRKVREMEFDPLQLREFALGFDRKIYRARMKAYLEERWSRFAGRVSQVSI